MSVRDEVHLVQDFHSGTGKGRMFHNSMSMSSRTYAKRRPAWKRAESGWCCAPLPEHGVGVPVPFLFHGLGQLLEEARGHRVHEGARVAE
ncbi:hypothetical protein DF19_20565 [Streptomyces olindensis]|nr:hypothetical protein DF19_20565 [Streptomyces olindensis]